MLYAQNFDTKLNQNDIIELLYGGSELGLVSAPLMEKVDKCTAKIETKSKENAQLNSFFSTVTSTTPTSNLQPILPSKTTSILALPQTIIVSGSDVTCVPL